MEENYKDIICLANSRKLGGRCIAGVDTTTFTWVRPVNKDGKELCWDDITLKDRTLPQVLDIIRVPVLRKEPLYYQPENYVINGDLSWKKIGVFPANDLTELYEDGPFIFENTRDYLTCDECRKMIPVRSLMIIEPQTLSFQKTTNFHGRWQIRAHFSFQNYDYNFVVTDVECERKYKRLDYGIYNEPANYYYLVISLGECFYGNHYKLVASIIKKF